MTDKTYTLDYLLNTTTLWTKTEHGCEVMGVDNNRRIQVQVTNDQLTERHPYLVHALSHWHNKRASYGPTPSTTSNHIANMLKHWEQPIIIHDTDGEIYNVVHVDEVADPDDEDVLLEVTAGILDYAGEIAYVADTRDDSIVIHAEKLEEQYPGWRKRLDIANTLETDEDGPEHACDRLLTSYVFSKSPVELVLTSSLPELLG